MVPITCDSLLPPSALCRNCAGCQHRRPGAGEQKLSGCIWLWLKVCPRLVRRMPVTCSSSNADFQMKHFLPVIIHRGQEKGNGLIVIPGCCFSPFLAKGAIAELGYQTLLCPSHGTRILASLCRCKTQQPTSSTHCPSHSWGLVPLQTSAARWHLADPQIPQH